MVGWGLQSLACIQPEFSDGSHLRFEKNNHQSLLGCFELQLKVDKNLNEYQKNDLFFLIVNVNSIFIKWQIKLNKDSQSLINQNVAMLISKVTVCVDRDSSFANIFNEFIFKFRIFDRIFYIFFLMHNV